MGMKKLWEEWGTIWFLEQFGLWVNQPATINLGYPKKTNFAISQGVMTAKVRIDDDVACFIHDSLNEMGVRLPTHKALVIEFYTKNRPFDKAGQELGLKRAKARQIIKEAEMWLDCKLNEYFKMTKVQREMVRLLLDESA